MSVKNPSLSVPSAVMDEMAALVSKITGVQLGDRQRTMVETRIHKRMLDLGLQTEAEYKDFFELHRDTETNALISLLTTHHTYFFREFAHFEALEKKVLPALIESLKAKGRHHLRVWSAACSRGQEVYSLSMFLHYYLPRMAPGFTFEILGTDVDAESIAIARNGVFHRKEIIEAPLTLVAHHWAHGTGEIADFVKAKSSIKAQCKFEVENLMALSAVSPVSPAQEFDLIFCRNVFIYFTQEQVQQVSRALLSRLSPDGFLFIGVSESLNGLELPVTHEGPSIYSKVDANQPQVAKVAPAPFVPATIERPAPIRILCVDDSPSVLALLKKVLTKQHGFEVVATAANGIEAAQALKTHVVDAMTLDIHMPGQTGLEYLIENHKPGHVPVVMITSVSRENSQIAFQCLTSGASDFIEKPALNNLQERGEEIRTKLLCAIQAAKFQAPKILQIDQNAKPLRTIKNPDQLYRAVIATYSSWQKLATCLKENQGAQPPTVIFVEGAENLLREYATSLSTLLNKPVEVIDKDFIGLRPQGIYLADFSNCFEALQNRAASKKTSIWVFGNLSAHGLGKLPARSKAIQILIEDPGVMALAALKPLMERATDLVPTTSFAYMCNQFLGDDK